MIRYVPWRGGWRTLLCSNGHLRPASSSSPTAIGLGILPCSESSAVNYVAQSVKSTRSTSAVSSETTSVLESEDSLTLNDKSQRGKVQVSGKRNIKGSIVAAAFASLRTKQIEGTKKHTNLGDKIAVAKTVDELLSVIQTERVTQHDALRIISILADWAVNKQVKLSDFGSDPRFVKLCHLLGKYPERGNANGIGELATVLGITGNDEAAKLVSTISLPQMIRVMTALSQQKRRATPLLRTLASKISQCTDVLDVKQSADLLYSMAVLNFPDDVLLEKISTDLCGCLPDNQRSAVVGSVLTSLGILRYKDVVLLDALTNWVQKNHGRCRTQDIVALILTLARLNHNPVNADSLYEVVLPQVTTQDVLRPALWLDVVWSLAVLGRADNAHLASVLSSDSVGKLATNDDGGIPITARIKLLSINGVAQLCSPGYTGPVLPENSEDCKVVLKRSRQKQMLVSSVLDSLTNLLPSSTYLHTDIDTGMGFFIDGECLIDAKCNPLPVNEQSVKGNINNTKETRVAVLVWDYHEMCRGCEEPTGAGVLHTRLLDKMAYQVLAVPYTEFNPCEKVVARVQYLEQRLKALARNT